MKHLQRDYALLAAEMYHTGGNNFVDQTKQFEKSSEAYLAFCRRQPGVIHVMNKYGITEERMSELVLKHVNFDYPVVKGHFIPLSIITYSESLEFAHLAEMHNFDSDKVRKTFIWYFSKSNSAGKLASLCAELNYGLKQSV